MYRQDDPARINGYDSVSQDSAGTETQFRSPEVNSVSSNESPEPIDVERLSIPRTPRRGNAYFHPRSALRRNKDNAAPMWPRPESGSAPGAAQGMVFPRSSANKNLLSDLEYDFYEDVNP